MDDVLSATASTLPRDDADEYIALPRVSGDGGRGFVEFVNAVKGLAHPGRASEPYLDEGVTRRCGEDCSEPTSDLVDVDARDHPYHRRSPAAPHQHATITLKG
jgi:hypothetical protein